MDDHPPSWTDNGSRYLAPYGLTGRGITRLNVFHHNVLAVPPVPVDASDIGRGLQENYSLSSLELSRCDIRSSVAELAQALVVNKYLQSLHIARNKVDTQSGVLIADALAANQTLHTLNMAWNDLKDDFFLRLAATLRTNVALQRLKFDRNKCSNAAVAALVEALSRTSHRVKHLSLAHNKVGAVGAAAIGTLLRHGTALVAVDLSLNAIPTEGVFALLFSLGRKVNPSVGTSLQTLNLSCNRVGDAVSLVPAALKGTPTLRELNLAKTCIRGDSEAFSAFCADLARNDAPALCSFSLAQNELGDEGVQALCTALQHVTSLRWLDIGEVDFTAASLGAVAAMAGACTSLTALHIDRNTIGGDGCGLHVATILNDTALQFLNVSGCGIGADGVTAMVDAMRYHNTRLTGLSIRQNQIQNSGFHALVPVLMKQKGFNFLDVTGNGITSAAAQKLYDLLEKHAATLPYIVVDTHTVVEEADVLNEAAAAAMWGSKRTPAKRPVLPPLTQPPQELPVDTFRVSEAMATFSVLCGSAVRKPLDGPELLPALYEYAGRPVKGVDAWAVGNLQGNTPNLAKSLSTNPVTPGSVDTLESNIGSLLLSDDQLRREFNRLDTNGNGFLEVDEFKNIYKCFEHFGVPYTEANVANILRDNASLLGDGKISFDEFCVVMLRLARS